MKEVVINADLAIAGRLGAYVAKQALLGHKIIIVNSEKAIISGSKERIVEKYFSLRNKGTPFTGPFLSRLPERLLKRIIRGMLSYKVGRGKDAFNNIMCYRGVPEVLAGKPLITVDQADSRKSKIRSHITIQELSKALGAKV